ncbi:hypothetical protein Tsubulata_015197 [Turnera subulata]|uniref:Uncharacterized protein n=1 Tax=Turnera subulata TaxID=218843 RepID=A0A9Q0J4E1_9ROSI|nr:hypothetical protein Tsubulata_015197 [Turnera subulata]
MVTSSESRRSSGPVLRSLSPGGRFHTSHTSSSSSAFASYTSSSFYSPQATFFQTTPHHHHYHHHHHHHHHDDRHSHYHHHHRSASPTRVNLYTAAPPSPSFRFSIDRSTSPNRSITVAKRNNHPISVPQKRTCMCSPTTHPGSFRCSLHKNSHSHSSGGGGSFTPNRLNMRRSAMTNSLVRIGGVEGEWVKRALTALIRPSSHQQRRRAGFQPRPSRLSVMSRAADDGSFCRGKPESSLKLCIAESGTGSTPAKVCREVWWRGVAWSGNDRVRFDPRRSRVNPDEFLDSETDIEAVCSMGVT